MPEGIVVEPNALGLVRPSVICSGLLARHICFAPITDYFKLKLPNPMPFGKGRVNSLWFRITGFKIVPSIGYTADFFGQGATFHLQPPHVSDIQFPPTGKSTLATMYIIVTRYQHYDQLILFTPLWDGLGVRL